MFPKTGNEFLSGTSQTELAKALGDALRGELGASHNAVKTAMRWTGATDRTAKNWLSGSCSPCASHLVRLAGHSDAVTAVLLSRAQRSYLIPGASMRRLGTEMTRLAAMIEEFHSAI